LAPVGKVSVSQSTWAAINSMGGVIASAVTNRGCLEKRFVISLITTQQATPVVWIASQGQKCRASAAKSL
jgi:hypothetical protein